MAQAQNDGDNFPSGKCYAVSAYIEGDFALGVHNRTLGKYQDFGYYKTKEDADVAAENLRIKGALVVNGVSDVIVTERAPSNQTKPQPSVAQKLDIPQMVMFSEGDSRLRIGDGKLPMVFIDNRAFGFGRLTMQFYTDGCRSLSDLRERQKEVESAVKAKIDLQNFEIPVIV